MENFEKAVRYLAAKRYKNDQQINRNLKELCLNTSLVDSYAERYDEMVRILAPEPEQDEVLELVDSYPDEDPWI